MDNLCFSVILMFYNHEIYAEQAISSVLEQEHNYSWELIICDDSSSDRTPDIIRKYEKKYPNIIRAVYRNQNKGLIFNRSDLIKQCMGKYIFILDGDDYWLPGKIKAQIEFLEEHPEVDICTCTYYQYETNEGIIEKPVLKRDISAPFQTIEGCHSDMAYRADIIKQYIGEVRPVEKIWEVDDVPLTIWLGAHAKAGMIDKNYYVIRNIDGSLSRPQKRDLKWWVNRYHWTLDMYKFYSSGEEEENDFIRRYEVQYESLTALQSNNIEKYRQCCISLGGYRAMTKLLISYMPFGLNILRKQYNNW